MSEQNISARFSFFELELLTGLKPSLPDWNYVLIFFWSVIVCPRHFLRLGETYSNFYFLCSKLTITTILYTSSSHTYPERKPEKKILQILLCGISRAPAHEVSVVESSIWWLLGLEKLIISQLHFYTFVDKWILICPSVENLRLIWHFWVG